MKYMKLGSKPDAFHADGNTIRYVASELATDVVICVGEVKFHLHKFPLLSKSSRLQKLVVKAIEENNDEVHLPDLPGGPKAFEICAKFCYSMVVTLNAYNVVATRCAAEYLEMTEAVERGNLIYKVEVFLSSSIFHSWKDSLIVLQTTKSLLPLSEELKIVGRCIDAIASKTSVDPIKVDWSYTCKTKKATSEVTCVSENGMVPQQKPPSAVPKNWWVEDMCELEINLYKRVMFAVKSKGRMSNDLIGEALRAYILKWLPDFMNLDAALSDNYVEFAERNRSLLETIIWLLPVDRDSSCSCSFLLKLLKVSILFGASESSRNDLINKIGQQLDEATVEELLIPSMSREGTIYDVDLVQSMVDKFMTQNQAAKDVGLIQSGESSMKHMFVTHESLFYVAKLVDGYLAEIASDPNLTLLKLVNLAESVPDSGRQFHDDLYRAIDMYLKEHPNLSKGEKRRLCSLMDVKKLSMDACVHAAQNERLPLRVVVQVLFYEQVKSTTPVVNAPNDLQETIMSDKDCLLAGEDEHWARPVDGCQLLTKQMSSMKIRGNDDDSRNGAETPNPTNSKKKTPKRKPASKGRFLLPSRSRRIFDKLWMSKGQNENKGMTDTSGSSYSPPTSVHRGETKSVASSSRYRRYSVS